MKVYLDDERIAPDGWTQVRWPDEAIELLKTGEVTHLSLDHDLGDDERGTGYDVVLWVERAVAMDGFISPAMKVHSANSSARVKMEAGIRAIEQMRIALLSAQSTAVDEPLLSKNLPPVEGPTRGSPGNCLGIFAIVCLGLLVLGGVILNGYLDRKAETERRDRVAEAEWREAYNKLKEFYERIWPRIEAVGERDTGNGGTRDHKFRISHRYVELVPSSMENSWGGIFIALRQIRNNEGKWEFDCLAYGGGTEGPLRELIEEVREELERVFPETRWFFIDSREGLDHADRVSREPLYRDRSRSPSFYFLIIYYALIANGLSLIGLNIYRFLRKKILGETPTPDAHADFPRSQSNGMDEPT